MLFGRLFRIVGEILIGGGSRVVSYIHYVEINSSGYGNFINLIQSNFISPFNAVIAVVGRQSNSRAILEGFSLLIVN